MSVSWKSGACLSPKQNKGPKVSMCPANKAKENWKQKQKDAPRITHNGQRNKNIVIRGKPGDCWRRKGCLGHPQV